MDCFWCHFINAICRMMQRRMLAPPQVMSDIVKVGAAIEAALGSAQDVEGVVDPDGSVYIVQTRPQV